MHCFKIALLSLNAVCSEVVGVGNEPAVPTATPADECSNAGSLPAKPPSSDQQQTGRWAQHDHFQYCLICGEFLTLKKETKRRVLVLDKMTGLPTSLGRMDASCS